jgi:hypothetical protein
MVFFFFFFDAEWSRLEFTKNAERKDSAIAHHQASCPSKLKDITDGTQTQAGCEPSMYEHAGMPSPAESPALPPPHVC